MALRMLVTLVVLLSWSCGVLCKAPAFTREELKYMANLKMAALPASMRSQLQHATSYLKIVGIKAGMVGTGPVPMRGIVAMPGISMVGTTGDNR